MQRWLPVFLIMTLLAAGCAGQRQAPQAVGIYSWNLGSPSSALDAFSYASLGAPPVATSLPRVAPDALSTMPADPPAKPTRDITFFVVGDTHFGLPGMDAVNRRVVGVMNDLPGKSAPAALGGKVGQPRGVIHCGDITDFGLAGQWSEFEKVFGLTGKDGLLRFPTFETPGNHDVAVVGSHTVTSAVARRHGGLPYAWNWDDVHLVCLGVYPNAANLQWLKKDLATVSRETPVVLFFHYPMGGPFSDWWNERDKNALAQAIAGYRVVTIFTGHYHMPGRETWQGIDTFRPGSTRTGPPTFIVARLTDDRLTVAFYDWTIGEGRTPSLVTPWVETFSEPLRPAAPASSPVASGAPVARAN